jgi:hypothetical protein
MKIIAVDNFGNEGVSDFVVAEKVWDFYAKYITDKLNERYSAEDASLFFRCVPNDHKLYEFKP